MILEVDRAARRLGWWLALLIPSLLVGVLLAMLEVDSGGFDAALVGLGALALLGGFGAHETLNWLSAAIGLRHRVHPGSFYVLYPVVVAVLGLQTLSAAKRWLRRQRRPS